MERIQLTTENAAELRAKAIHTLKEGGLIIFPTETCYGIGADATNQAAVDRLLAYKTKRADKPLSVAVYSREMAERYVEVNDTARNIYDNMLPGPITVVSRGKQLLADGVESSMGTQGVRIPDYPFVLELLKEFNRPMTSTSANASNKKTPYTIEDILNNTSKKQQELIGLIIDAGTLPRRKPSTVIDTTLDNIHIVREGSLVLAEPTTVEVHSEQETQQLALELFTKIEQHIGTRAVVFLLQGELGAGKTHFTKFFAQRIGVSDIVKSPTFLLQRDYVGAVGEHRVTLHHIDTYRMYEAKEMEDLRPQELFAAPNIVVIEWANKVADSIKQYTEHAVVVKMRFVTTGPTDRRIQYDIIQPHD